MNATSEGGYASDVGAVFDQALRDGAAELSVERLFAGALGAEGRWREICEVAGLDRSGLRRRLVSERGQTRRRRRPSVVPSDPAVQAVLEQAGREARSAGAPQIEPVHVLLALLAHRAVREALPDAAAAERAVRSHLAREG